MPREKENADVHKASDDELSSLHEEFEGIALKITSTGQLGQ